MYDIIGDIHGYAKTLEHLLRKMGYVKIKGIYRHPERKAVFLGDFVDRGPDVRKVVKIVRRMCRAGYAYAVMGNHEFNYISYNTFDKNGEPLREHSEKNIKHSAETELSYKNHPETKKKHLKWFQNLPLFIEFDNFRVIHACWDFAYIERIKELLPDQKLTPEFLINANTKGHEAHELTEVLLKGKELILPKGTYYIDKDGNRRRKIRYKWWRKITPDLSYRQVAVNYEPQIPKSKIPMNEFEHHQPYLKGQKPVFVGHYWQRGTPKLLSHNVCCVDYGLGKCRILAAYRFDGEQFLNNDKFVYVKCLETDF